MEGRPRQPSQPLAESSSVSCLRLLAATLQASCVVAVGSSHLAGRFGSSSKSLTATMRESVGFPKLRTSGASPIHCVLFKKVGFAGRFRLEFDFTTRISLRAHWILRGYGGDDGRGVRRTARQARLSRIVGSTLEQVRGHFSPTDQREEGPRRVGMT